MTEGSADGGQRESLRELVEVQLDIGNASKRARAVALLILEQGSCTTSDIEALGYKHSPRAVRDLRDAGVTITTTKDQYVDSGTGKVKQRARYAIEGVAEGKTSRRPFSKATVEKVKVSGRCEVCGAHPPLQVDHRVPFDINGETYPHVVSELMPLCPSCNRTKSWKCEHCPNRDVGDPETCKSCMWASPTDYQHVATRQVREVRAILSDPEDIRRFDEQRPNVEHVLAAYLERIDNGGSD